METRKLNPLADTLIALLKGDGGFKAAEQHIEQTTTARMNERKAAWERAQREDQAARMLLNALSFEAEVTEEVGPPPAPAPAVVAPRVPASALLMQEQAERKAVVLDVANKLATQLLPGETLRTLDVLIALQRRGVTLPGSKPGTSIGNILHADPTWKRVSEGVYQRV